MPWPPASLPVPQNWVDGTTAATVHANAHNVVGAALDDLVTRAGPAARVYSKAFAYNTAGLAAGITAFTPVVGDVLIDAWFIVTTAFNGTTPMLDIGTFVGTTQGLYYRAWTAAGELDQTDPELQGDGIVIMPTNRRRSLSASYVAAAAAAGFQAGDAWAWQGVFTATNPIKLVVSQDGTAGGTAIGGTTGAGTLYLMVATPSAL